MTDSAPVPDPEDRIRQLETQVKHLNNELRLTREEYESANTAYYELFSRMEKTVEERSLQLKELQGVLELKGRELQIMLDLSPVMIFYKDAGQRFIRVNKRFSDRLGRPIGDIIGSTLAELLPGQRNDVLEDDSPVLESGEPLLNQECALALPDARIPVLLNKIPYKDIDSRIIGIIGFALDLTDIKKAEEEKEELQAQLLQAQKMEAIGTLAGGIAHDFNNLLMIISGYAEILLQDIEALDGGTDGEFRAMVDTILAACTRAQDVAGQVLAFSRQAEFHPAVVQIEDVINETFGFLRETIDRKVTLSTEIVPGLHAVLADPGQLQQVLMNLCTNALHAMSEGGNLKISARNATLDRDFVSGHNPDAAPGEYLSVTVSDTGCGMDEETLQHVFEPFFTTKGIGEGTGLGMATVYGIVRNHTGLITVDSAVGQGTSVRIFLPRAAASTESPEADVPEDAATGTETILLVEDEKMVRELMIRSLSERGYSVLPCRDGEEALAEFAQSRDDIDLVVLDLAMPRVDGIQVLQQIRAADPEARVIVVSGHVKMAQKTGELAGVAEILKKPFKMGRLCAAIRKALDSA